MCASSKAPPRATRTSHKLQIIRRNTKCVVALGDCAVNGNVPSMRNPFTVEEILNRAYVENARSSSSIPRSRSCRRC